MFENKYKVGELAELSGVTKRTIHYYLSRGLLPPSEGAGITTTYSDEHLYRIMLIKKYQESYLPLDEIKKIINPLSLAQVQDRLNTDIIGPDFIIAESQSVYKEENLYKKISLGYGIEIYYPVDNEKSKKLVDQIYLVSEKFMKEG